MRWNVCCLPKSSPLYSLAAIAQTDLPAKFSLVLCRCPKSERCKQNPKYSGPSTLLGGVTNLGMVTYYSRYLSYLDKHGKSLCLTFPRVSPDLRFTSCVLILLLWIWINFLGIDSVRLWWLPALLTLQFTLGFSLGLWSVLCLPLATIRNGWLLLLLIFS